MPKKKIEAVAKAAAEQQIPAAEQPVQQPAEDRKPAAEAAAAKKPAPRKRAAKKPAAQQPAEERKPAAEQPAPRKRAAKKPAAQQPAQEQKPAARKPRTRKPAKPAAEPLAEPVAEPVSEPVTEPVSEPVAEPVSEPVTEPVSEPVTEPVAEEAAPVLPQPRRSVAFIGSECYPFVKTGGLGDVMYALPKALAKLNCDVKVILPRYRCIPQKWQEKMIYRGSFMMDLCSDGRSFYVGIMEYVADGVVYDFIDNEEFFSYGNPYTNLVDDIPRFCYFDKAALAALNYMEWVPDVIHCHDWQAGLVPIYLRTLFAGTPLVNSKSILTIHNLRFQGVYNIPTIQYWTNLPDYVFNKDVLTQNWVDANMLKGGLTYCDRITTVSGTYAGEIQTAFYGEGLDAHLRFHCGKLRGIVNGIDVEQWDSRKDPLRPVNYGAQDAAAGKRANKLALQEQLGLEQNADKMVLGLISRLTNQKGLDLVNAILPALVDGNTQVVVLGTGDACYEESFRSFEQRLPPRGI